MEHIGPTRAASSMVFYWALEAVAARWGDNIGVRWTEAHQTVPRFGLNRADRGAVERVAHGYCNLSLP